MARDELQYRQSQVQMNKLRSQVRLEVGNAYIALQQAVESHKAAVEARTCKNKRWTSSAPSSKREWPRPMSFFSIKAHWRKQNRQQSRRWCLRKG